MDLRLLYRYLKLESFSKTEINNAFDEIRKASSTGATTGLMATPLSSLEDDFNKERHSPHRAETENDSEPSQIEHVHVRNYLLKRISEFEANHPMPLVSDNIETIEEMRLEYAGEEAKKFMQVFPSTSLDKKTFTKCILKESSTVDLKRVMPIAASMLLVGSSVGIVAPVMPFVVENLGLTPGQYGLVVSAFALAKMAGNVPSAILVERHGRKPYLVYSLSVVALGVGGIGLATQFEHLYVCRLLTGFGVAALSTAATMTMSDISTPRNRASTMAPIMSAFAAGTALGPAFGGVLADTVGISPTFYIVGVSYLGLTAVNHFLLTETKTHPMTFPWQQTEQVSASTNTMNQNDANGSISVAVKSAVGQWAPLLSDPRIRNVVIMNAFYWFSLAGSQMTLLPLMLTDPSGLAMTATGVGKVYMGMSLVQVLGNPTLAKFVDRLGKGPAIVCGCTLISSSMAVLPFCTDMYQMAGTLGMWAFGSTMLSTAPVAYVSDTVGEDKRAQGIALLRTAGDVGFLVGATGTGALADWTGNLDVAMQSSAGLLLTATGWFATRQFLKSKLAKEGVHKS